MEIRQNAVVTIHYTVRDDSGCEIDTSRGENPLPYIQGTQTILPELEAHLEGKKKGDTLDVRLPVDQAYGYHLDELVEVVGRDQFEKGQTLEEGMEFTFEDEDDEVRSVRVTKVAGDEITIDGNHPFAGLNLNFSIEVTNVREATAEELDHGHVLGPHDHHH